jgi:hypothetical protein
MEGKKTSQMEMLKSKNGSPFLGIKCLFENFKRLPPGQFFYSVIPIAIQSVQLYEFPVMSRRRKNEPDWLEISLEVVATTFILALISPEFRQALKAIGSFAIFLACACIIGLIGFVIYRRATRSSNAASNAPILPSPDRPLPVSNNVAGNIAPQTASELPSLLRSMDWFQFEKLVALLYRTHGYAVEQRGGANPDGGIDLLIEKDGRCWAVQCKQWKAWKVGVKAVREFLGALTDAKIQQGIFITLCGYTEQARQLAEKHGIEIISETRLVQMIESTNARFDPEALEILHDKRKFCPKCEREMVLRTAAKGPGAGTQFWGCSGYPKCRFTLPMS